MTRRTTLVDPARLPRRGARRLAAQTAAPVKIDSDTISGLGARNIGSAAMSGRIAALDAVQRGRAPDRLRRRGQRRRLEVGQRRHDLQAGLRQAAGAVDRRRHHRSEEPEDRLGRHRRVLDAQQRLDRRRHLQVDRRRRELDATWGCTESERIAKILVDPTDGDTVYACAPGKLWSDSDERGVYKTTDGGKTWTKVLKGANLSTGCSMISMDRKNPKTLYAGMWDFRRKGWTFRSGGDGPERAERQRPLQVDRRRRDLDRARRADARRASRPSPGAASR